MSFLVLSSDVISDFRRLFVPLAWFEILYKSGVAILGIAGGTALLAILSRSTGSAAVTNTDIVDFLLSPVGGRGDAGHFRAPDDRTRAPGSHGDRGSL
jgi:hypothetical protein